MITFTICKHHIKLKGTYMVISGNLVKQLLDIRQ